LRSETDHPEHFCPALGLSQHPWCLHQPTSCQTQAIHCIVW